MFTFDLVDCKPGEILKDSQCLVCQRGTYQLEAGKSTCLPCPENFSCTGGNNLSVDQGFWRPDEMTNEVYPCLEQEACLGGFTSECKFGYEGRICSQCIGEVEETGEFYARAGKYGCQKCDSTKNTWLKLSGIFVFVILYIAALVSIIIYSANRKK